MGLGVLSGTGRVSLVKLLAEVSQGLHPELPHRAVLMDTEGEEARDGFSGCPGVGDSCDLDFGGWGR